MNDSVETLDLTEINICYCSVPKCGFSELRPTEVRPADVRPLEVGPAEVRLAELRPAEVRLAEVRPEEDRPAGFVSRKNNSNILSETNAKTPSFPLFAPVSVPPDAKKSPFEFIRSQSFQND